MLSHVEALLLSLVAEKPSYAYELEKEIEWRQMRRWVKIGVASIYQVLRRLERKGLVTSKKEREGNLPERSRYFLTERGREELVATAKELLSRLEWYYLDLNLGLECSHVLTPEEIAACLKRRLKAVESNLKRLDRDKEMYPSGSGFVKSQAVLNSLAAFRRAERDCLLALLDCLARSSGGGENKGKG